jgi:hypothetical protein
MERSSPVPDPSPLAAQVSETRLKGLLWRPMSREAKVRIGGSWFAVAGINLGMWNIGFGFDNTPRGFGFGVGPLFVAIEQESVIESYDDLWNFGRTLYRLTIQKWKLEIRLEFDLNIWSVGYTMADLHDHGIYLGPLNVQIEYDKCYDWPDDHTLPTRLQCRCDPGRQNVRRPAG